MDRAACWPSEGAWSTRGFLRLLGQVRRLHRRAASFLSQSSGSDLTTYGDFLAQEGFSPDFVGHYALPLVSCVWSSGQDDALRYPARYLFTFLDHHGMLSVKGSPQWHTVEGGSSTYVARVAATLAAVNIATPITGVARGPGGVRLRDAGGATHLADRVVIATHADQALRILEDPTDDERAVLSAFGYSRNQMLLHTDSSILPRAEQARASWNYLMSSCTERRESTLVSYWMNRLQGHAGDGDYIVTLNGEGRVSPASVIAERRVRAPAVHAGGRRGTAPPAGTRLAPDRLRRGVPRLGVPRGRLSQRRRRRALLRSAAGERPRRTDHGRPAAASRARRGHVMHQRFAPFRRVFRHELYQWLVDLDDVPRMPPLMRPLASFSAADHLGDERLSISENVERFVALQGVDITDGRVLMLANARVLGHVFDPLSVFWCFDAAGTLRCIVAEVRNTYGERHAYLLEPDTGGRAETDKRLYVSPFFDVSGRYQLRFRLDEDLVGTTIVLRRSGEPQLRSERSTAGLAARRGEPCSRCRSGAR